MITRNLTYYGRLQLLLACSFIVGAGSIPTTNGLMPAADAAPHAGRAISAKPSHVPKVQRDPFRELKGLETRFFFHEYDRESPERRLQRLENAIFGCSQTGTNEERLDNLKAAVSKRDGDNARQLSDLNKQLMNSPAQDGAPKASAPTSSQQFPVLDTLEWRVLKKTYQKESLDQRLERLETALIGQPSPAISYFDRVDRLKKIVGIDIPAANPFLSMPIPNKVGPTSPLIPRQRSMLPRNAYPFGAPFAMPQARRGSSKERTMEEDFQLRSAQDMATILRHMNKFMDQDFGSPGFMGSPGFSSPNGFSSPPIIIPIPNRGFQVKERERADSSLRRSKQHLEELESWNANSWKAKS